MIGKFFAIEAGLKDPSKLEGEERQLARELRLTQRRQESKPALDKLKQWGLEQRAAPKNAIRKAIEYIFSYWDGFGIVYRRPDPGDT